jgi:hypothetical protein
VARAIVGSLVIVSAVVLGQAPRKASAATINVPADQPTIQAGINAALAGDVVLVAPGSYNEALTIPSRTDLTIRGSGLTLTTIIAPGQGPAFNVLTSTNITITGFRIQSAQPGGDQAEIGGIRVLSSRPVRIFKNLITQCAGNGIVLYGSDVEAWNNAIVQVGDDGIRMEEEGGVAPRSLLLAYHNTIASNRGGSGVGVWMRNAEHSAILFDNIFYDNDYNIGLQSNSSCIHDYNLVSTTATNYFGAIARAPNEPDCNPAFVNTGAIDYHLTAGSCAEDVGTPLFSGTPAAADDFDDQPRPLGAQFELGADEIGVVPCSVTLLAPPPDVTICLGGSTDLDAGPFTTTNCPGGAVTWDWTDGLGGSWTTQVITIAPVFPTTYTVTAACANDPSCLTRASLRVDVEEPPKLYTGTAIDVAPCTRGILLDWQPALFNGAGPGVYNIYRSEIDCGVALAQPPLALRLAGPPWIDQFTVSGATYSYLVEAEEGSPAAACQPVGPGGGAIAQLCLARVTDEDGGVPPAGVYAALRARHVGDFVTMLWPSARALLAGEHFHLLKTVDRPTNAFVMINAEQDVALAYSETDVSSWIQFFDLRIANACEAVSDREYPPGFDP